MAVFIGAWGMARRAAWRSRRWRTRPPQSLHWLLKFAAFSRTKPKRHPCPCGGLQASEALPYILAIKLASPSKQNRVPVAEDGLGASTHILGDFGFRHLLQFGFSAFEDNNFVAFESESSISSVVLSDESGALAVHGVGANERAFDQLAFAAPPVWAESNKLTEP